MCFRVMLLPDFCVRVSACSIKISQINMLNAILVIMLVDKTSKLISPIISLIYTFPLTWPFLTDFHLLNDMMLCKLNFRTTNLNPLSHSPSKSKLTIHHSSLKETSVTFCVLPCKYISLSSPFTLVICQFGQP